MSSEISTHILDTFKPGSKKKNPECDIREKWPPCEYGAPVEPDFNWSTFKQWDLEQLELIAGILALV